MLLLHSSFDDCSESLVVSWGGATELQGRGDERSSGWRARTLAAPEIAPEARCHVAGSVGRDALFGGGCEGAEPGERDMR